MITIYDTIEVLLDIRHAMLLYAIPDYLIIMSAFIVWLLVICHECDY